MKAAVIGATSGSGKVLTKKLLEAGHSVTAYVRTPEKVELSDDKLAVIQGDVQNDEALTSALKGSEVVFSFLGPKGKVKQIAAQGTENILKAMDANKIKRLVLVSVAGIAVPDDNRGKTFIDALLRTFLKDMYADREAQLEVLRGSKVKWSALRVPRLTDEQPSGGVEAFFGKPSPTMKLSRADLADFMIRIADNEEWINQAPIVVSKS